jgi:Domain of unknown function (DUF1127)
MSSTVAHDLSFRHLVGTDGPARAARRSDAPSMTPRNDAENAASRVRALASVAEAVRAFSLRLRAELLARRTRRITNALDEHLRRDIGLPPCAVRPSLAPMMTASLR